MHYDPTECRKSSASYANFGWFLLTSLDYNLCVAREDIITFKIFRVLFGFMKEYSRITTSFLGAFKLGYGVHSLVYINKYSIRTKNTPKINEK